ncbi:MAG TPA: gliding motility-associated C-terminal domain-containing protein, partial [Niastella sp.]
NFNTFSEAVNYLSGGLNGGVTIDVAPGSGPYYEQFTLDRFIKSTATKPLIFNCNGVTLSFNSTNQYNRAGIKLDSVDYVTIDNLVIVPTAVTDFEYGVGIHLVHDADHNIIRNCFILNTVNINLPQNNEGIVINGSDDFGSSNGNSDCDSNLIIRNKITGGFTGITMSSVPVYPNPAVLMRGNQIIDNQISNFHNSGIYLFYNDNTLVQGNDITGGPDMANDGTGITCFEPNINMRIIGNRIHHFVADPANTSGTLRGINLGGSVASAVTPNLVANNLIYDFQSTGDQFGISAQYGGSYLNLYHNTISLEYQTVTGAGSTNGIWTDDYSNINILNNIITISRATTGRNYGIYMSKAVPMFTSNRNLLYVPSGSSVTNAVGYNGGTQSTIAAWRTKTGQDLLSVSSDPKYTDPVNFVLIPTDSTIDNMGQYININNDFAGAVRNNTHPDIGAYEFLTPACVGPVLGGNTTILPGTTVCEGSPVALNLTGNSFGTGQLYQWQTSVTINGTYTNLGTALSHPASTATPVTTLYYRAAVTCGSLVEYSVPMSLHVTPRLTAGTYTINSAVATGGANFQSYNDALNAIRCGVRGPVVFNVAAGSGPYREQLIIPRIANTSATNTVTFNGNGTTLVYLSTTTAERAVIKLNGTRHFIFDNLNIVAEATTSGQYGLGVQMLNDADANTIRNCTITMSTSVSSTDLVGIVMSPSATSYTSQSAGSFCDSNTITSNTIIGGNIGIACTSSGTEPTLKNTITNNIFKDGRSYGIWISGTRNALVAGNDVSRPSRALQFNSSGFWGIFMDGSHQNLLVTKNKVHNLFDGAKTNTGTVHGIFNSSTDASMAEPIIVSNNLIYNMNGNGEHNAISNSGADSVQYYHNTISLEDSTATAGTTRGFYSNSEAHGLILKNNSIVIKRGGTGTKTCIFINNVNTTFTSDYNNLLNAAKTGTSNFIGRVNATNHATIEAWRTAAVNDDSSLNVHPNYQDPANVDFTPTLLTMDNKGTPVGITTDIKGVTRRAKPDIGAFEFDVCVPLGAGPDLKVDTATTSMARFSWTAVTNATGYKVSTDGVNFVTPSSGATGLSHTITGLTAGTKVSLIVQAQGTLDYCPKGTSKPEVAHLLTNQYFVPNTFTPNRNGKNDVFIVRGSVIGTMRLMIFNQWGEKIFETSSQQNGWDGTYKGKQQPVGVYVYVLNMTLQDGTVVNKKGTINLIR